MVLEYGRSLRREDLMMGMLSTRAYIITCYDQSIQRVNNLYIQLGEVVDRNWRLVAQRLRKDAHRSTIVC